MSFYEFPMYTGILNIAGLFEKVLDILLLDKTNVQFDIRSTSGAEKAGLYRGGLTVSRGFDYIKNVGQLHWRSFDCCPIQTILLLLLLTKKTLSHKEEGKKCALQLSQIHCRPNNSMVSRSYQNGSELQQGAEKG